MHYTEKNVIGQKKRIRPAVSVDTSKVQGPYIQGPLVKMQDIEAYPILHIYVIYGSFLEAFLAWCFDVTGSCQFLLDLCLLDNQCPLIPSPPNIT